VRSTALVAAASLVLGFAVAQGTGVRVLGGLVLVAGAAWCAVRWRARAGAPTTVALLALYAGAFVVSHLLADALGAWPSVVLAAAVVGAAAHVAVDARAGAASSV